MEVAAAEANMREQPSPTVQVEKAILRLRRVNVMLDSDLARMYGVDVRTLNQAVKRHRERKNRSF